MALKNRIERLESSIIIEKEPLRISRFIVAPGIEPKGYISDGVEIIRKPDESIEALHKRCSDAVEWPDGNYRHVFDILEQ